MRTTLNLDDDLYEAAKSMATAENRSIGDVISRLLRKALQPPDYTETGDEIPAFSVSEKVRPLTLEMVREADEDSE